MGIKIEFNPDLALRNISEFKAGIRKIEECVPENIAAGKVYDFLKNGQRCYWFEGEVALRETNGNQNLSRPLASVKIIEATHFLNDNETWTRGKYEVLEIFSDDKIYFDWMDRVK
jgi:hypothetical protein